MLTSAIVDEVRQVTGLAASGVERLSGSDRLDTAAKGALYTLGSAQQPTTSEPPQSDPGCPAEPYVHGVSTEAIEDVDDLRCADFSNASLSSLDGSADLRGADLRNAQLSGASLGSADVRNADLRGAYLHSTNFGSADLRNADLREARDRSTANFAEAKTEGCQGCP